MSQHELIPETEPDGAGDEVQVESLLWKGAWFLLVILAPLCGFGALKLVLWILSNPHIFLLIWMSALGIGVAAEYYIEHWIGIPIRRRSSVSSTVASMNRNRSISRRRRVSITEEQIQVDSLAPLQDPVPATGSKSKKQKQPLDLDSCNNFASCPMEFDLQASVLASTPMLTKKTTASASFNGNMSKLSGPVVSIVASSVAKLLSAAAPGVSNHNHTHITTTKTNSTHKSKPGLTDSFLERNKNAHPEQEWGTIASPPATETNANSNSPKTLQVIHKVTKVVQQESEDTL